MPSGQKPLWGVDSPIGLDGLDVGPLPDRLGWTHHPTLAELAVDRYRRWRRRRLDGFVSAAFQRSFSAQGQHAATQDGRPSCMPQGLRRESAMHRSTRAHVMMEAVRSSPLKLLSERFLFSVHSGRARTFGIYTAGVLDDGRAVCVAHVLPARHRGSPAESGSSTCG